MVKRSANRSAVAASAYRSGERLIDERFGDIHDYTRRSGVDEKFIMAPSDAPSWTFDRSALWNTVEVIENRKNSQLAREFNVALPIELSKDQNEVLLREWVQNSFVDRGMVADVAMHDMKTGNPHAHVLLTTRAVDADGFVKNKNRDWHDRDTLKQWREDWANVVNEHLEKQGHDERVSHLSLEEQGIDRRPTIHLGPHVSDLEKQGIRTDVGDLQREILYENSERAKSVADHEETVADVQTVVVEEARENRSAEIRKVLAASSERVESGESIVVKMLSERQAQQETVAEVAPAPSDSEGLRLPPDAGEGGGRRTSGSSRGAPVRGSGGGRRRGGLRLDWEEEEEERKKAKPFRRTKRGKGFDI